MKLARIGVICVTFLCLLGCLSIEEISEDASGTVNMIRLQNMSREVEQCLANNDYHCDDQAVASASPGLLYSLESLFESPNAEIESVATRDFISRAVSGVNSDSFTAAGELQDIENMTDEELSLFSAVDEALLLSPVQQKILTAMALTSANDSRVSAMALNTATIDGTPHNSLPLTRREVFDWLDTIYEASSADAFDSASSHYRSLAVALEGQDGLERVQDNLYARAQLSDFASAYTRAFFRNGKLASLRVESKTLVEKIKEELESSIPEEVEDRQGLIERLTDKLVAETLGGMPVEGSIYTIAGEIGDTAFVTRGGVSYSFPAVNIDIDPLASKVVSTNEVDYATVGANLVRVWIEAMGDALFQLPADESSTAVKHSPPLLASIPDDRKEIAPSVNEVADRAEGLSGAAVGKAIRGISWFSMNNETLAQVIETSIAVAVRKGTEKLAWCYYSCRVENGDSSSTSQMLGGGVYIQPMSVEIAAPRVK